MIVETTNSYGEEGVLVICDECQYTSADERRFVYLRNTTLCTSCDVGEEDVDGLIQKGV